MAIIPPKPAFCGPWWKRLPGLWGEEGRTVAEEGRAVAAPEEPPAGPPAARDEGVARLAAFSDAVFAIAMTLLVLELKPPALPPRHGEGDLWHGLAQWH